jgi:uncharacterized protein YdaU (DUF1376 family)
VNYFEHHIGDYDADTAHLTWCEDMAYTRLLRLYYRRERPIPHDVNEACRLVRATAKDQRQAVANVLNEFFVLADDGWHQGRCDAELARYMKKVEHNREVGKLGGRPRKTVTREKPAGLSVGSVSEPEQNPPQTPVPKQLSKPSASHPPAGGKAGGFDEFWKAWPKSERKQDKAKCLSHWKLHGFDAALEQILADIRVKRGTEKWAGGYIEAPLVYLRGRRWEDGVTPNANDGGQLDWRATRSGIERMGESLGLGRWDEEAAQHGRGERFAEYERRVLAAEAQGVPA